MGGQEGAVPFPGFERVLERALARVFVDGPPKGGRAALAVAYSGGRDSTVLLHLAQAYAQKKGWRLAAFHIHHGLNREADAWLAHCRRICAALGVDFDACRVTLQETEDGIEAAARSARYAALAALCRRHGVKLLLTAHHEDDQAETVLMQLLRGSGTAGLSGMEVLGPVPGEPDGSGLLLLRPLLSVSGQAIACWAAAQQLAWVEDDSNQDSRYARNALRQQVMPVLARLFPGAAHRLSRSAGHMQAAERLLASMAEADYRACRDGNGLDVGRVAALDGDRFNNLFRFWLRLHGVRMPSVAWLAEARRQLLDARQDAQVRLELEGAVIRRYRQRFMLVLPEKVRHAPLPPADRLPVAWRGESHVCLPPFGGAFVFEPAEAGVDAGWLLSQPLYAAAYHGKALFKDHAGRPARQLKAHYQEKGVPPWERERLPLLFAGETLLFAAGIGMAASCTGKGEGCIRIAWLPGGQGRGIPAFFL
ncbi:MAG: tRNA lysidine(34) synthetase TilS [Alistipes senegalensis]|nr:tRNA lysidine(34) synthetase TilS [Oxalobacter formigenes]MCM1280816.1 tRNA lysidine(34) synthetase TilS [Alistipes senegalensis]